MFQKVLVANRGEIACRILRTLRRMGIPSVAVYSDADASALHVRQADEAVRIGGAAVADSYLKIEAVLAAARQTSAQAIHPGYGLLSENADFAAACESAGIAFVGPTPMQMIDFGLKHRARELALAAGVPVSPGSGLLESTDQARVAAEGIGFPVLLKATAGGGGIGMRLCRSAEELEREYESVRRLAGAHFGNAELFLEKYVENARHVEVQLFGDGAGHVLTLGDRDCSLQRRSQKVVEEAPAANLDPRLRGELHAAALALGKSVSYRSAGTIEFLVDPAENRFYFLEVNTRLQVEHCVTEEICRVDLVEWMLRVAAGDTTPMKAYRHEPRGCSIEVRLYAEDAGRDFRPSSGALTGVTFPEDARVETWIESGTEISPFYDPLLAKVVVAGATRDEALDRLSQALQRTEVGGIATNLEYLRYLSSWPVYREHRHHTRSLNELAWSGSAIDVVHPGALTTVQDYPGRVGYWDIGVPPSGPMDWLAFRLGNRIVGNADGVAGLELTVHGPTLHFRSDAVVCLTGAPVRATLHGADSHPVPMWQAIAVSAGAQLTIGAIAGPGARAYLLVRGGFDVPEYLGSRSTFTLGGFGGHAGRPLRAEDVLPLGSPEDRTRVLDAPLGASAASALTQSYPKEWTIRVLDGPHGSPEFFTPEDIERFYADGFEVHFQSARTGVRLIGPKPAWARSDGGEAGLHPSNIHDTAYSVGSIDFTGDMPVILGPDGPSLGGFVCPAVVIHADRWKLGQLRPADRVYFQPVTAEEAESADAAQELAIGRREPVAKSGVLLVRASSSLGDGIVTQRAAYADVPLATYRQSGDRHVLVEYGPMVLDINLRARVQLLWSALSERHASGELNGIVDLTPGIRSLQIHFDPSVLPRKRLLAVLERIEAELPSADDMRLPTRVVHLPLSWDDPATREAIQKYMKVVRDDAPWCPSNIEFIRRINGLDSHDDVKRIVFDSSYLVLGLGDVYLGAPVATPIDPRHRLVTTKYNPARTWTPENAVGIGGAYMCIYGMEGPGGYQFVGRTVPVWNTYTRWRADTPWLLRFFDQIRFYPVSAEELLDLRHSVRAGRVDLRIEETVFDLGEYHRFLASIEPSASEFRNRQRQAFAEEREHWRASGEFESAKRAEGGIAVASEVEEEELPEGCVAVSAPMGAQVWKVTAAEGEAVEAGHELLVLAAMKMETPVVSPSAGRVEKIFCREGDVVAGGATLIVLRVDDGAA